MTTFVLVSGAWHAGWCWERVVPLLEAAGHRVLAPDLVGMGPDSARFAEASLDVWTDQLEALIRAEPEPVVLVGHSRGGLVIGEVAERVPERISRLVYLAAFLLEDGQSIAKAAAGGGKVSGVSKPDSSGGVTVAPETVRTAFYNETADEWVDRAIALLTAEPAKVLAAPARVTPERFGSVPRAYVECLRDRTVTIEMQRAMQQRLPCDRVAALDTDHSPFYSQPEALVEALLEVSR